MIIDERLSTYIDSVSWSLPDYLREVETEALAQEVPIIRRSMQTLLQFLVSMTRPMHVLEIGTAVGFSGMLISEKLPEGARLDTIEKVPQRIKKAKENFAKYQKNEQITLIEGDAIQVLEQLVNEGKIYDFIFMDAAKGQYVNFLEPILSLLAPGGILVTDNVLQEGDIIESRYAITRRDRTIHGRMREYLYLLTHSKQLESVILPVGDGASISLKKG